MRLVGLLQEASARTAVIRISGFKYVFIVILLFDSELPSSPKTVIAGLTRNLPSEKDCICAWEMADAPPP